MKECSSKRIAIITPLSKDAIVGNQITALRIRRLLRQLSHKVSLTQQYEGDECDILIALHALRSGESIHQFKAKHPLCPVVVILTGTDLYCDIKSDALAQSSLEIADRLVVLQEMGLQELPERFQAKTRVIYQSATKVSRQMSLSQTDFNVCVIANIRAEKDPFLTAKAARLLPAVSRIKVNHIGGILDKGMEKLMLEEIATNPRYKWLGPLSYHKTRRELANSHLLSITSRLEGSSNVLSEALASRIPVI